MFSNIRNLTYLTLLCAWGVCIVAQDFVAYTVAQDFVVHSFSKKFKSRDGILYYGYDFNKIGDRFSNYTCNEDDSNSMLCNVTVESWPFAQDSNFMSCENYKLTDNYTNTIFIAHVLPDNHIFFFLITKKDNYNIGRRQTDNFLYNIKILNVENCTTTANIQIMTNRLHEYKYGKLFPMIRFDKIIEVQVQNEKFCEGVPSCKISYDFNGTKIGGPIPFPTLMGEALIPVFHHLPEAGYYSIHYMINCADYPLTCMGFNLSYIDSSGSSKTLMTEIQRFNYTTYWDYSNNGGLFGSCIINKFNLKLVNCLQFDTEAMRFNVTLNLPNKAGTIAVHNLVGGGMLVLIIHCDLSTDNYYPKILGCDKLWIQRIGADGHKFKPLLIDVSDSDYANFDPLYRRITENDQNEFCFMMFGAMGEFKDTGNYYTTLYNKFCIPTESTLKL